MSTVGITIGAIILALALFIGLSIPIAQVAESKIENPGISINKVVIRHVNLVPMDSNHVLRDHAVFIDDNVISQIVIDSLAVFTGYQVIDAKGQFLLPGLLDMHAHIFDRSDLINYLAYGVTRVRNMMGFPMHLRWKRQWATGDYPGSEMVTASPTLNFGEGTDPFHKTLGKKEDAAAVVQHYFEDGYDFIKIYDGLTQEQFTTIMKKSKELGLKVAGHPPILVDREELLNSNLVSFEHIEEVYNTYMNREKDDSLALVLAREFAKAKMPVCITLSAYHNIYQASNNKEHFLQEVPYDQINPLLKLIGNKMLGDYLNPSDKLRTAIAAKRGYLSKLTKLFYDEGVPLIFGTDTGPNLTVPGYTVHQELQFLSEAGLPNFNILKSATLDAAVVLGEEKTVGSISVGKRAEFLLVATNPLMDLKTLKQPTAIMANKVWYDSAAIQTLTKLGKKKSGMYVTMGNLLSQFFNK